MEGNSLDTSRGAAESIGAGTGYWASRLTVVLVCAAGLWFVCQAIAGIDGPPWRLTCITALALVAGPMVIELRIRGLRSSIRVPLLHPVVFACAVAVGPAAALPAIFGGVSRLLAGDAARRPAWQVLYTIFAPPVICATAALAYARVGGSALRPQEVDSLLPLLCSGMAYLASWSLLSTAVRDLEEATPLLAKEVAGQPNLTPLLAKEGPGEVESSDPSHHHQPRPATIASWSICFAGGYALAILYSVVPAYVLLAPVAAAGLVRAALWDLSRVTAQPEAEEVVTIAEAVPEADDQASFVDPMTGLASRRYVELFLGREVSRSERLGKPVSVAVFDVDGFQKLTESAGQETAEGALREIAQGLKQGLREYDVIGRYSGGRLVVVLPESTCEQAFEVVDRLHRKLAAVKAAGSPVSISVGIAEFPSHAAGAEDLVNSAHRALNSGKFSGTNKVYSCRVLEQAG